jgi:hypothetical protein
MLEQTTITIRTDIHKHDKEAEEDDLYDIQDTRKYDLSEFTPNNQKIILDIVEKDMHDYVEFCP